MHSSDNDTGTTPHPEEPAEGAPDGGGSGGGEHVPRPEEPAEGSDRAPSAQDAP